MPSARTVPTPARDPPRSTPPPVASICLQSVSWSFAPWLCQLPLGDGGLHRVHGLLHQGAEALVLLELGQVLLEDLRVGQLLPPEHRSTIVDAHLEAGLLET